MNKTLTTKKYKAVVIGVSAGGMAALPEILSVLPESFPLAVIIVQHRRAEQGDFLSTYLNKECRLEVHEAGEKYPVSPGVVYIAPPGYHLLIERDFTFSLSVDPPVHFSRPSIDVLFESAADAYGHTLIGVILTGASSDGALGLKRIRENSGLSIVQDPKTAETNVMPQSAIDIAGADHILPLEKIGPFLVKIGDNL